MNKSATPLCAPELPYIKLKQAPYKIEPMIRVTWEDLLCAIKARNKDKTRGQSTNRITNTSSPKDSVLGSRIHIPITSRTAVTTKAGEHAPLINFIGLS
jgi:hypothetical protein